MCYKNAIYYFVNESSTDDGFHIRGCMIFFNYYDNYNKTSPW